MRVLDWVPPVILIPAVASQVLAVIPRLQVQVTDRTAAVEVAHGHSALVGLVVNRLGAQHVLLLLAKALEDMVWANFHDVDFLLEALVLTLFGNTSLIGANFSQTTAGDHGWLHAHESGVAHRLGLSTTVSGTKCLLLAVWVPVIMRLIKPVILLERVIKVAVCPVGVWLNTKEPGHLGLAVRLPIILSTYGVQFLVKI